MSFTAAKIHCFFPLSIWFSECMDLNRNIPLTSYWTGCTSCSYTIIYFSNRWVQNVFTFADFSQKSYVEWKLDETKHKEWTIWHVIISLSASTAERKPLQGLIYHLSFVLPPSISSKMASIYYFDTPIDKRMPWQAGSISRGKRPSTFFK